MMYPVLGDGDFKTAFDFNQREHLTQRTAFVHPDTELAEGTLVIEKVLAFIAAWGSMYMPNGGIGCC